MILWYGGRLMKVEQIYCCLLPVWLCFRILSGLLLLIDKWLMSMRHCGSARHHCVMDCSWKLHAWTGNSFLLPSVCTAGLASRGLTPKAPAYWVVCTSCAVCKLQGFVFEYISHVPATCVTKRWSMLLTLCSTMLLSLRHLVSLKAVLSFEFHPILLLFSCRHLTFSVYNRARHIFHFIFGKGQLCGSALLLLPFFHLASPVPSVCR